MPLNPLPAAGEGWPRSKLALRPFLALLFSQQVPLLPAKGIKRFAMGGMPERAKRVRLSAGNTGWPQRRSVEISVIYRRPSGTSLLWLPPRRAGELPHRGARAAIYRGSIFRLLRFPPRVGPALAALGRSACGPRFAPFARSRGRRAILDRSEEGSLRRSHLRRSGFFDGRR